MAEHLVSPPRRGLADLAPRQHETVLLRAGQTVWRVYFREPHDTAWNTFRRYGPAGGRFDHHFPPAAPSPDRAVLYGAAQYPTCLAEVFQDTRLIDRLSPRRPHLAAFVFGRDLRLLDVAGPWTTRAGGSMAINSGSRETAREWSRAIYAAFPDIDGILYASSMDGNRRAYAFYDRAQSDIRPTVPAVDLPLNHPALMERLTLAANRLGYRLV